MSAISFCKLSESSGFLICASSCRAAPPPATQKSANGLTNDARHKQRRRRTSRNLSAQRSPDCLSVPSLTTGLVPLCKTAARANNDVLSQNELTGCCAQAKAKAARTRAPHTPQITDGTRRGASSHTRAAARVSSFARAPAAHRARRTPRKQRHSRWAERLADCVVVFDRRFALLLGRDGGCRDGLTGWRTLRLCGARASNEAPSANDDDDGMRRRRAKIRVRAKKQTRCAALPQRSRCAPAPTPP